MSATITTAGTFYTTSSKSFSSTFSATENPISESGAWVNNGVDWTAVRTSGGIAFGTQTGSNGFDDSYAHLTGFPADYEMTATVFKGTTSGIQEIELLFRATDSANSMVVYEINFAHDGQYCDFVRWHGPKGTTVNDFSYLVPTGTYSISGGVNNGDIIKGRIQGNVLNAWINKGSGFVLINSSPVTDTAGAGGGAVLTTGNPGIGFYREAASGAANQYGFTDYSVVTI